MIEAQLLVTGLLATARAGIARMLAPETTTLERVYLKSDTIPAGGNAIFDVNINGTSIWDADQTQRPKILDGDSDGDKTAIAAAVTENDVITIDFDGFSGGTPTVGSKLIIVIEFAESSGGGSDSGMLAYLSNSQSIPNNAETQILLDTADSNDGLYSATDQTAVVPAKGYYIVAGMVTFASNATGKRSAIIAVQGPGGGDPIFNLLRVTVPAVSGDVTCVPINTIIEQFWVDAGFRIWLIVYQNSGGALNALLPSSNEKRTYMAVVPAPKV